MNRNSAGTTNGGHNSYVCWILANIDLIFKSPPPPVPIRIPNNNDPEKRYNVSSVDRDNDNRGRNDFDFGFGIDVDVVADEDSMNGNGLRFLIVVGTRIFDLSVDDDDDDGGGEYFKNLVVEYVVKNADDIIHIAPMAWTFDANADDDVKSPAAAASNGDDCN